MYNNAKEELNKKKRNLIFKKWIGWFMCYYIFRNAFDFFIPFVNLVLILIGIDKNICSLICNVYSYFFLCMPIYWVVSINSEERLINEKIKDISMEENNSKTSEKNKILDESYRVSLEKKKDMIQKIITRFEALPRDKQIEVLNSIKETGNLDKISEYNLDISTVDILQDEFVEILYPSFNDKESGYTRKRDITIER